jgi:hypothetical protein
VLNQRGGPPASEALPAQPATTERSTAERPRRVKTRSDEASAILEE